MTVPRSVLFLCQDSPAHAGNVLQHIDAIRTRSRHRIYSFNPVEKPDAAAALDLDEFDAVLIHYTIMVTTERYLSRELADKIVSFRGLKLQLIQDEYRAVDAICAKVRELGIDVLYTCVPPPEREEIYEARLPGVTLITTLPGLMADELGHITAPPIGERPIDVGYRGRDVPYWLGRLGREKVEIGERFRELVRGTGLRCDISSNEADRIYGEAWIRFLASCRSTLGTESGASIIDFDGTVQQRVSDYLARKPDASFEEVEQALLAERDGRLTIHVASPRLFEAAALRTAMVLFRGEYSGAVEPWTHYIPLEKDFSNFDEVVRAILDVELLESMVERAWNDLVGSGAYSLNAFVSELDAVLEARSTSRSRPHKPAYRRARLRLALPSLRRPSKLRTAAGKVLTPLAGALVVVRDPALRGLAAAGLRRREVRRVGLARDLLRLVALCRGVAHGAFSVELELDPDGRTLLLRSTAHGSTGATVAELGHSLSGEVKLTEIVWNHSAVGISAGLLGTHLLALRVGHHGVEGAHSFRALARLACEEPDRVRAVFATLLPSRRDATGSQTASLR